MDALSASRTLVVVAHPDDAEIAAGGTIARLVDVGSEVTVAVLALPETGPGAAARTAATEQAAKILGYRLLWVGDSPVQVSDLGEVAVVRACDALFDDLRPALVLTHPEIDSHVDHVLTARGVLAAARKAPCDVYHFRPGESRSPGFLRFQPTVLVDITATAARKRQALQPFTEPRDGFRAVDLDPIERTDSFYGALLGVSRAEGYTVARQRGLGPLITAWSTTWDRDPIHGRTMQVHDARTKVGFHG